MTDKKKEDLDNILEKVGEDKDFQQMMGAFTEAITKSRSEDDNDSDILSSSDYSLYDLLTEFFTDSKGNNLCEIMSEINSNLKNVAQLLEQKK